MRFASGLAVYLFMSIFMHAGTWMYGDRYIDKKGVWGAYALLDNSYVCRVSKRRLG